MAEFKRIFVMTGYHNDWLYTQIMPILRARYGATFYIVAADDRIAEFRARCADGDTVVSVNVPELARHGDGIDSDDAFARARAYEEKYNLTYMLDLVQQDHGEAANFLNHSPNSIFGFQEPNDLADTCDYINRCFAYFETFLKKERIDLIIDRPGGLSNSVMVAVAQFMDIPVTFIHGSYYEGKAVWANGPYMGAEFYGELFDKAPDAEPVPLEDLAPSATWTRPPPPSYKELCKDFAYMALNYSIFMYQDLRRGARGNRVPLWNNVRSRLRQFKVRRHVDRVGISDWEMLAERPFVYMALPHEPEFTIQSMCREFADTPAIIRQIALSLPAGYDLVLKEHQRVGNRPVEYYESFRRFPNVKLAHPSLRGVDLIGRCAATATLGGSTPAEAAQFGKPSIVFSARNPYGVLPSVKIVTNLRDLAAVLRDVLSDRDDATVMNWRRAAARFRGAYDTASFDATDTILFRGGTKTSIPEAEVEKAVKALLAVASAQRGRLVKGWVG